MDRGQAGHVDDDSAWCLGLTASGVTLSPWDDGEVVLGGVLDHHDDVGRVGGPQDGCGTVVNGVAVVVRGPRERVFIGVQGSGECGHGGERLVH